MYCPTCGQQQLNDEIRFCSRCGFLLSDVAEVVANKGISPYKTPGRVSKKDTPRKRGLKQGGMVMLIGFLLVVPILAISMPFLGFSPFLIPMAAIITLMGGLLRMIYAYMFESNDQYETGVNMTPTLSGSHSSPKTLPDHQSIPADAYVAPGKWMETNDLAQPPSVTESTTKLLQKEE
jgi:hypothetical protein